jgi:hypothetical protein
MKKLAILALVALEILVCSCGNSTSTTTTPTTSASGKWQAVMSGGVGQGGTVDFVTAFTAASGGGPLDITAFSFLTTGACFVSGETESGSATLVTDSTNHVTGTLSYTVTSGTPAGNTLILTGTTVTGTSNNGALTGGVVTGTWQLNGGQGDATCTVPSGTFTMTQSSS